MAQQGPSAVAFEERGFLDRFPWYVQLLALLGIVVVIGLALDYYLFRPSRLEAEKKLQEVAQLRRENQEAEIIRNNIVEFEKTLAELNQRFDDLKVRIPEQREVSAIFENVRALISDNGLSLVEYKSPSASEVSKNYYTEVPSYARVAGTYSKVQNLFQALSNYQRILNVTEIQIKRAADENQARGATTESGFNITAFYISEANRATIEAELQEQASGDKKGDDKKGGDKGKAKTPAKK